jgi:hypothetical protein
MPRWAFHGKVKIYLFIYKEAYFLDVPFDGLRMLGVAAFE